MEDHYGKSVQKWYQGCKTKDKRNVQMCLDILEQLETEPNLLKRVVTGDLSWIFEYNPFTKRQSLEWKSTLLPRPKKAKIFKSKTKVMLVAFFLMTMELST